jgi:immune inhibitor A peptidase M6
VHAAGDGTAIGVHCHEFGHLLGLPDAYGAGHVTGCGDFCLMAIGHRGGPTDGARSPFSLCAWCRMRMGWSEPVVLDPRVAQRVRLSPSDRSGDVAVVPLSPRTDEYLLLEVRNRTGFDAELPDAGLLVWHVGGAATPGQGRYGTYADLVEAHGLDRVDASLVRTDEIAFPTRRAHDLTPETVPAVRPAAPDGLPAWITDIGRAPGGCVDVTLGVVRRVHQAAPDPASEPPADGDGFVVRTDPITGAEVRLYVGEAPDGRVPLPQPATGGEERR